MPMYMQEVVENYLLVAPDGRQLMRETNTLTPNGNHVRGRWVLRDVNGIFIDFDKYSHDLMGRHDLAYEYL